MEARNLEEHLASKKQPETTEERRQRKKERTKEYKELRKEEARKRWHLKYKDARSAAERYAKDPRYIAWSALPVARDLTFRDEDDNEIIGWMSRCDSHSDQGTIGGQMPESRWIDADESVAMCFSCWCKRKPCSMDGCNEVAVDSGLCRGHFTGSIYDVVIDDIEDDIEDEAC